MKKTLKLVGIFMAVTLVVLVGGLSIYFLVQNNRTYYIYDLRIVEPVSNARGYVYTDSTAEFTSIKNKTVYMTADGSNRFEIVQTPYQFPLNPYAQQHHQILCSKYIFCS